jgi:hypothetical protein
MQRAFFGRPQADTSPGGTHVTVYLAPVYQGQLVVFDIHGRRELSGRWLPWTVLPFQGNPYEAASGLADTWCRGVSLLDLSLVDVMSFVIPGEGWELAIVFRAELASLPEGDPEKRPVLLAPGRIDAIGSFDPVDLERWVGAGPGRAEAGPKLLF